MRGIDQPACPAKPPSRSRSISLRSSSLTRSSASRQSTQSLLQLATAKSFCERNPWKSRSMMRAPSAAASSCVPSLECESTTTISSQNATERRHAWMRSASLYVMMAAESPGAFAGGTRVFRNLAVYPALRNIYFRPTRMSPVLFFDPGCPVPYSRRTLEQAALGGTEATVVRIAEALDAQVMQHNRGEREGRYLPAVDDPRVEHLIVLRDPRRVRPLCARFAGARPYLWLHDLVRPGSKRGRRLAAAARTLADLRTTLICVSDFQRKQAEAVLERAGVAGQVHAITIYNPIDDALAPNGADVDREKLVFLSSPNKGLGFALDAFAAIRRALPDMRLCIASPGYKSLRAAGVARLADRRAATSGVEWLGALPHERALEEARSALCVFYPNFVLPETFGLVFA